MTQFNKSLQKYRGTECLNCGHLLDMSDKYCPNCSQVNSTKKVSFSDVVNELLASVFSYDSKLRKTLATLFFKPGKITEEYVAGKRLTYTNPFRFFLSMAIIYVFILGITSGFSDMDHSTNNNKSALQSILLNEKVYDQVFLTANGDKINNKNLDSIINATAEKKNKLILSKSKNYFDSINRVSARLNRVLMKFDFFETHLKNNSFYTYQEATDTLNISSTFENKISFNAAKSFYKVEKQPGSFLDIVISRTPFYIFFFLPVFAIFIWFIYSKKKYNYMDHLIFGFHTQTMFTIILILSYITELATKTSIYLISLTLFLYYLYKSMRKFYKQGRIKTIVKFVLLNTIFFILASITVLVVLIASAITY